MLFVLREYYQGKDYIVACVIYMLALILSLSMHEFAHAFTAYKCGDETPKMMGRVTLNPLAHLDPLGIICAALFYVGWAKPVQVNPLNFKKYKKGMALVSSAGVITNFILAFLSCGIFSCILHFANSLSTFGFYCVMFFLVMYSLNITLCVFNFLPFYPLDGFNLLDALTKADNKFVEFLRKYGQWILIILLVFFDRFLPALIGIVGYPITAFWGLIF